MTDIFNWTHYFLAQHSILAPLAYVVLHTFFAIFLIPCSPMTVIAGALWGKWLGLGISVVSAVLSSCVTFGLARHFFKNKIYAFLIKRFPKTDWFLGQTKKHGWKFVASVQLNPAAPASTLGYLFGLTNIEFSIYLMFSVLFMLPLQFLLVVFGDSFVRSSSSLFWILACGIIMVIGLYLGYKKFFHKPMNGLKHG